MQMKFMAKTAINLRLILISALFASDQAQPAQGSPSPSAAATPGASWTRVVSVAKHRHVRFSEKRLERRPAAEG
jgi:hypothetical protein